MTLLGNSDYQHGSAAYDGILLVNLGTPAAATAAAVRRWLGEFLADPRVVELPRPLWWLILHFFILPVRPLRLAKLYQSIWHAEGSPLLVYSQRLTAALRRSLSSRPNVLIDLAMCYGEPSIAAVLSAMQKYPVRRLLVLPLYPQYSSTTTAPVFHAVTMQLQKWRWLPEVRFITDYHDDEHYIAACAQQIAAARAQQQTNQAPLLLSFHGLPYTSLLQGDPYHCQCQTTARLIAERLQLHQHQWRISFQSRFGRGQWLQPYTDKTVQELAQQQQAVDVFCPGFAADCLETLEEINIQNRALFRDAGGRSYRYIAALNDSPAHRDCLLALIQKHSCGWDDFGHCRQTAKQRATVKQRAIAMGAKG